MSKLKSPSNDSVLKNPAFLECFNSRRIKVVAPASGIDPEQMKELQLITDLDIELPCEMSNKDIPYHACSDDERFEYLKNALYDESKDTIIWTLRGGYGSARLIDRLSTLPAPKYEKTVIGFSDITALHLFLSQHWHWNTIHGAGFAKMIDPTQDPQNYLRIAEIVANCVPTPLLNDLKPLNVEATTSNAIKGNLTGGNLTVVETSIGTSWQIQTAGKIVFLEETGEKGYRVDRSLNHLRQAGLLNDVKAIVFGTFMTGVEDKVIHIALERFAKETAIPVYKSEQFGHGQVNYPLIYNRLSEIKSVDHHHYGLFPVYL